MNIRTTNVDSDTLSTEKTVSTESKQFKTPAKALQVGKIKASETVTPLARGIAEIYIKSDSLRLERSCDGWENLANNLHRQAKRANDDEFVIPFVQYDDRNELSQENAAEIAKLETNYGDIVPVPLMTPLVNAADNGDGVLSEWVPILIENTKVFLEAVDELGIEKPVMGVIPPISKECTTALLEMYIEYDLQAYCVDFNRRSPMAKAQLDSIQAPLMRTLNTYDIRDRSLLYAVNANESRRITDTHQSPGALYAYTLGFDIVGDKHLPPRYPPEVFEDMEITSELRLFDADALSIVKVLPEDLESFLPEEAEIPVDRVRQHIANDVDEKFRFEKLINAELIALYLDADDGVDVREIFVALRDGSFTQESDLERVRELVTDVSTEDA